MPSPLPPEIKVHTTPRGELIEMPPRDVGCMKIIGVPLVLIGLGLICWGLYVVLFDAGVLNWLSNGKYGGNQPLDPFKGFFAVMWFLFGSAPIYIGTFLLGGKSTIELRDDVLIARQTLGPARRKRKVPIKDIRTFQIKTSRSDEAPEAIGQMMGALNVIVADDKLRNITWGYPKDTLRALALYLTESCEQRTGSKLVMDEHVRIGIEERTLGDDTPDPDDTVDEPIERSPRPDNAVSAVEVRDDGVTITVPPVGVWKGSKGGLGFSIMWNGFMLFITCGWVFAGKQGGGDLLFVAGILGLFWVIGIWMLIAAINAGRRMAILDVVGDTLLITRQNIFGTKQQEIPRDNIRSIRRDKSGVEINDVPILNLQIRLYEGKKISLFSQLDDRELSWLASELRGALDVPSR